MLQTEGWGQGLALVLPLKRYELFYAVIIGSIRPVTTNDEESLKYHRFLPEITRRA